MGMLSVIPVMTSIQVVARELGIDINARGDCHTTLVPYKVRILHHEMPIDELMNLRPQTI